MIRYCKKHFAFLVGYPRMGIFAKELTLNIYGMKKIMVLLVMIVSMTIFNSCVSCGGNDDALYDEEYWNSVSREKAMRKAGLTWRADIEKDERQARLKKMKENPLKNEKSNVKSNDPVPIKKTVENKEKRPVYGIKAKTSLLDKPNGNKILNEIATNYFGKNHYYEIGNLDKAYVLEEKGDWVKVQNTQFETSQGWIKKTYLISPNNSKTERKQRTLKDYKGSAEQKSDLDAIDEYSQTHPGF